MTWKDWIEILEAPLFTLGQAPVSLQSLAGLVLLLAVLIVVTRVLRRLLRTRVLAHTRLDEGLQYLISRIFGYGVLALGLVIGLQTIGVDLSSLAVLAGALGVGIGFGLQNVVNSFVSGLVLMGERSIQLGDRVEVGTTAGRVTRIGARSTTVQTNDNISIIVPNSEFVANRFINWSLQGDRQVRLRLRPGVSYKSDPHRVTEILEETAAANPHVLKEPAPQALLREFGDSSLNFELRVWTEDMVYRPGVLMGQLN
ncbi:mechanosensitive ion channel, partial [bacterium]|nr:mechanosensitive ion channel [bacterium]